MSTATPPPKPASRPPAPPPKPAGTATPSFVKKDFKVRSGVHADVQKTVVFGPGGSGKSSLCASLADIGIKPIFLDIGKGTHFLDVDRYDELETLEDVRSCLQDESLFAGYGAVVIDDLTRLEEMAGEYVVRNVKHEKEGRPIRCLNDYGFGKGLEHVYDEFLKVLGDLDRHARAGRHVVCIAHECTAVVTNPLGDDFRQYQPRLQTTDKGKASIRHRVKEWCDHMLFIGYDVAVDSDGKATGGGSRTIYCEERPTWWAKTRDNFDSIPFDRGSSDLWKQLFKKGS